MSHVLGLKRFLTVYLGYYVLLDVVILYFLVLCRAQPTGASNNNNAETCLAATYSFRVLSCYAEDAEIEKNSTQQIDTLRACLEESTGERLRVLSVLLPDTQMGRILLENFTQQFSTRTGIQLSLKFWDVDTIQKELLSSIQSQTSAIYNVFVYNSEQIIEYDALSLFADFKPYMNQVTLTSYNNEWSSLHTIVRTSVGQSNGKIIGAPFVIFLPYMSYRRDVFQQYSLSVPATWEQLLEVAEFLNQTAWTNVSPRTPLCFVRPKPEDLGTTGDGDNYVFTSIFGSMVQYKGLSQGLLVDPVSGSSLVDTPAFRRALTLYRALLPYVQLDSVRSPFVNDIDNAQVFTSGGCAIALRWTEVFKSSVSHPAVKGRTAVSPIPGSAQVMNRETGDMVACTPTLCPYADTVQPAMAPSSTAPFSGSFTAPTLVNRVHYGGVGGFAAGFNAFAAEGYGEAAYTYVTFIAHEALNSVFVFNPLSQFGPSRTADLAPTPDNVANWTISGYDAQDTLDFLTTAQMVMGSPNAMMDLKLPNGKAFRGIMDDAQRLLMLGEDIEEIVRQTDERILPTFATTLGMEKGLKAYRTAIGATQIAPNSSQSSPEDSSSKERTVGIAAGVAVGAFVLVAVCVALLFWVHQRRQHSASDPVSSTTSCLLVTDIQGSTQLWEKVDGDAMGAAVELHFALLRKAAIEHQGLECATEGDAIILVFPSPAAALAAALESQEALLMADWPSALLADPLCAPVYAEAHDSALHSMDMQRCSPGNTPLLFTIPSEAHAVPSRPSINRADKLMGDRGLSQQMGNGSPAASPSSPLPFPLTPVTPAGGAEWMGEAVGGAASTRSISQVLSPKRMWGAGSAGASLHSLRGSPKAHGWRQWWSWVMPGALSTRGHSHDGGSPLLSQGPSVAGEQGMRSVKRVTGEGVTLSEGSRPLGASVQEFLQSCVETVPLPQPSRPAQLVFRGMRVRMGIRMCDSWADRTSQGGAHQPPLARAPSLQPVPWAAGMMAPGRGKAPMPGHVHLASANAICAAGHGGQVLMTLPEFITLPPQQEVVICHMGLHTVNDYSPQQAPSRQQPHSAPPPAASPGPAKSYVHIQNASYQVVRSEEPEALDVYCAVQPNMAWRLAWSQPLRYSRRLSPGVLQAPYGAAAVCFINVVGAATLMAWNTEVAQESLATFHAIAARELMEASQAASSMQRQGQGENAGGAGEWSRVGSIRVPGQGEQRLRYTPSLGRSGAQMDYSGGHREAAHGVGTGGGAADGVHGARTLTGDPRGVAQGGDGYLVSSHGSSVLAAFKSPAVAIRWALSTQRECLDADWPEELLEHELGEEIVVGNNIGESVLEPTEEIFELQPNPPPAQGMHGESAAPRRFLSDQLRANNSEAGSGTGAGTAAGSIAAQSATTAGSHAHFVAMAGMAQREGSSSTRSVRPGVAGSMGPGVAIDRAMSHAFLGRAVTRKTLLFRGLRLKCGIDVGPVRASLETGSARVMYFGQPLNRAARVAAMAKTGQVWCTEEAWVAAMPTINAGVSTGPELFTSSSMLHAHASNVPTSNGQGTASNSDRHLSKLSFFHNSQPLGLVLGPKPTLPRPASRSVSRATSAGSTGLSMLAAQQQQLQAPAVGPVLMADGFGASEMTGGLSPTPDQSQNTDPSNTDADSRLSPLTGMLAEIMAHGDAGSEASGLRPPPRAQAACASSAPHASSLNTLQQSDTVVAAPTLQDLPTLLTTGLSQQTLMKAASIARRGAGIASQGEISGKRGVTFLEASPPMSSRNILGSPSMLNRDTLGHTMFQNPLSSLSCLNLMVAGVPLGPHRLRGVQEEVHLMQCRFDDESVVPTTRHQQGLPDPSLLMTAPGARPGSNAGSNAAMAFQRRSHYAHMTPLITTQSIYEMMGAYHVDDLSGPAAASVMDPGEAVLEPMSGGGAGAAADAWQPPPGHRGPAILLGRGPPTNESSISQATASGAGSVAASAAPSAAGSLRRIPGPNAGSRLAAPQTPSVSFDPSDPSAILRPPGFSQSQLLRHAQAHVQPHAHSAVTFRLGTTTSHSTPAGPAPDAPAIPSSSATALRPIILPKARIKRSVSFADKPQPPPGPGSGGATATATNIQSAMAGNRRSVQDGRKPRVSFANLGELSDSGASTDEPTTFSAWPAQHSRGTPSMLASASVTDIVSIESGAICARPSINRSPTRLRVSSGGAMLLGARSEPGSTCTDECSTGDLESTSLVAPLMADRMGLHHSHNHVEGTHSMGQVPSRALRRMVSDHSSFMHSRGPDDHPMQARHGWVRSPRLTVEAITAHNARRPSAMAAEEVSLVIVPGSRWPGGAFSRAASHANSRVTQGTSDRHSDRTSFRTSIASRSSVNTVRSSVFGAHHVHVASSSQISTLQRAVSGVLGSTAACVAPGMEGMHRAHEDRASAAAVMQGGALRRAAAMPQLGALRVSPGASRMSQGPTSTVVDPDASAYL